MTSPSLDLHRRSRPPSSDGRLSNPAPVPWAPALVALLLAMSAAPQAYAQASAPVASKPAPKPAAKPAGASGVEGVISRVADGDTLTLQPEGKPPIDVRLRDMDAPEICQDYGPEAKKALERFALGKTATLTTSARDSYGRSVGLVIVDGQSLSRLMVADGHAWSTRSRYDRGPLMKEERMAIALRRGVHSTQGAVMPKDFRKTNGPCK